jgi:3-hydroxybutyryl-CoA dehydrogenase
MPIEEVGVLGCGLMGAGIVEVCARQGLRVTVVEIGAGALVAGKDRILRSLDRALAGGKLEEDPGAVMQRIQFADDMAALSTGDVILEAIVEDQEEKMKAFSILDEIANEDAILASNTSSIPIINLAAQTTRPESVIGIH